jgi:hypothetical protein
VQHFFDSVNRETMGCGASAVKVKEVKPKQTTVVHPEPYQPTAINNATRTRDYYRNSLGNEFLEGFSRTGDALSRKNTMRSNDSVSLDRTDPNPIPNETNDLSCRKEFVTSASETENESRAGTQPSRSERT